MCWGSVTLCHLSIGPIFETRPFMVQLLPNTVSGCKLSAPYPHFKNPVSIAWQTGKKDKTKIHLLRGCLQRAAAFIASEMQRPHRSGHLHWDYKGSIVLRYTDKSLYNKPRRRNRMHLCFSGIYKEYNISRTAPYQLSIKIILLWTARCQPIHHFCHVWGLVSWFNPTQTLSTTQPRAHSPSQLDRGEEI